ncbi:MAG: tripartite tricarboxylate transporter substrate binding protein [Kiloniellales bacterium]|nr:tripartite tricarboxylate transporter substrate binding protein [Kiloniellales bacterium]
MASNMKSPRRRLGLTLAALVASALPAFTGGHSAEAEEAYPQRPVQIIVAYGAGGGTDRQARLLAAPLEAILGTPVTVQNLPGGGGQVAATALLREAPDGHTILAGNQPDINMSVAIKNAPYELEDLQVILVDLFDPRILLVRKDSPIRTFDDFVEKAEAEPGSLTVSVSQGGAQEQFAKWLFGALGIEVRLVGYKGGSRAANAMVGGQVVATMGDDSARLNIRDEAHALLLGAPQQSPRWPEAPTLVEALKPYGVTPPTPDFLGRYGVYVVPAAFKAKHPQHYAKLQQAMIESRQAAAFQENIAKRGIGDLSIGKPGEDFAEVFAKGTEAVKAMAN